MGAKRGSRGGRLVKERRRKEEERFRDKCDEIELKLATLSVELKLVALSDFLTSEMPVVENTPKVNRRGPMPTLTCDIANCTYTCKYRKHMKEHQTTVHAIKAEDSMLDKLSLIHI